MNQHAGLLALFHSWNLSSELLNFDCCCCSCSDDDPQNISTGVVRNLPSLSSDTPEQAATSSPVGLESTLSSKAKPTAVVRPRIQDEVISKLRTSTPVVGLSTLATSETSGAAAKSPIVTTVTKSSTVTSSIIVTSSIVTSSTSKTEHEKDVQVAHQIAKPGEVLTSVPEGSPNPTVLFIQSNLDISDDSKLRVRELSSRADRIPVLGVSSDAEPTYENDSLCHHNWGSATDGRVGGILEEFRERLMHEQEGERRFLLEACPFYYGPMTNSEAKVKLRPCEVC